MAASQERNIEDALVSAINSLSTGATVVNHLDNSSAKALPAIVVHVQPGGKIMPNYSKYEARCDVTAISHMADDGSGDERDADYNAVSEYMDALTAATLSTLSGEQVDGIVPVQGVSDFDDDGPAFLVSSVLIYMTRT